MKIIIKRDKYGRFIEGMPFQSEETRKKISASHMGIGKNTSLTKKHRLAISKGMKRATAHMKAKELCGDALYQSSHKWMQRWYGKPQKCDNCDRIKPPDGKGKKDYFHWANIDGIYVKDRFFWKRLCAMCHRNYDLYKQSNK